MIDMHSHLLFGIDDGPADLAGSLAMARRAVDEGIAAMVATPHSSTRHPNTAASIAAPLAVLRESLREEGIALEVLPGAEIAVAHVAEIDDGTLVALGLGGGPWLLIEPPFTPVAPGLEGSVVELLRAGHRVLLAHPERSPAIHRDPGIVERLVEDGVLTSVTAGSLVGRFGSHARRLGLELIERGLAHNVASDAHDARDRPPSIARELVRAGLGGLTDWLADEVPAAILEGGEIPERPPDTGARRGLWRRAVRR
jgi:protein-tyrosine phosphatase